MKQLITACTGVFLCLSLSVNAQTSLYVPGGTVGNITGTSVGVGTSTPSTNAKLDVRGGSLQVINYSTNGYGFIARDADPGNNDSYFYHRITANCHIYRFK